MNILVGLFSLKLIYLSICIKKIFKIMNTDHNSYLRKVNYIMVSIFAISHWMKQRKETK